MNNLIENRQIRVFISSTFRDMQDERDYLMKRTFPKLRKLAAERDVTLTELDLRWGITEEESKSGKVVEICLREIENSIPFFIGIIGNRYGWVPEKKDLDSNVTERFNDVNNYLEQHLSVTEMEMQFGVLAREEDMHAYFYIKEQEEKDKQDYPEMLERLKEEVRASRYPANTYSSPEDLSQQVEHAFSSLLNKLFPKVEMSDLEKERIGQRAFMNQLCMNYIEDKRYYNALEEWLNDKDNSHLVITGASGLGKSALIANWIKKIQQEEQCLELVYTFVGQGYGTGDIVNLMAYINKEICEKYQLKNTLNEYRKSFRNTEMCLSNTLNLIQNSNRRLLIIVDGIDHIIGHANCILFESDFIKIKILITKSDKRIEDVRFPKNTKQIELRNLNKENKRLLVTKYLRSFGKSLTSDQLERIVCNPNTDNTLLLRNLLDELICCGYYETLDSLIDNYIYQVDIVGFYQKLLSEYEKDFTQDIVQKTLSIIALSENGLEENEIIGSMNLKPIEWSQLFNRLYNNFQMPLGEIAYANTYIYNAVRSRYLDNNEVFEQKCRRMLIDMLSQLDTNHAKKELAFQLMITERSDELHNLLLNLNCLKVLSSKLVIYWEKLLSSSKYSLSDYKPLFENYSGNDISELLEIIIHLCEEMDSPDSMLIYLTQRLEHTTDDDDKANVYYEISRAYELKRNFQQALKNQSLSIERYLSLYKTDNQRLIHLLYFSYRRAVFLCEELGDNIKTLDYKEKEIEYAIQDVSISSNKYGLSYHMNNLAESFVNNNMFDRALPWAEKVVNTIPDDPDYIELLATIYQGLSRYYDALMWFEQSLKLRQEQEASEEEIHDTEAKIVNLKKLIKQQS